MAPQFLNFGNDETFHFFKWVSEGGQVDPKQLIRNAYKAAEENPDELTEGALGLCHAVKDRLAELLEDVLEEGTPVGPLLDQPHLEIGCVRNSPHSLWEPILALALGRVSCGVVAQALLMQAGKWAPEKDMPEFQ
jgi:hypothetical protein